MLICTFYHTHPNLISSTYNLIPSLEYSNLMISSSISVFSKLIVVQLEPAGSLLPVMVWVHGGSFVTGSGNYVSAGPDWLLAEGVVVVTFNYRLGAFGN